jgi:hypothetical protein
MEAGSLLRNDMKPECLFLMSSTRDGKWRGRGRVDSSFNVPVGVRITREAMARPGLKQWLLQCHESRVLKFGDFHYSKRKNQQSGQTRFPIHALDSFDPFYSLSLQDSENPTLNLDFLGFMRFNLSPEEFFKAAISIRQLHPA